jgi:choice-of-anchor C domain-containing protein
MISNLSRAAIVAAVVAASALSGTAANAISFTNGSFENGVDPGSTFVTLLGGSTAIDNWVVGGASIDYIGGYWQPEDGSRSLDLNGWGTGSISQTITGLTVGTSYQVSFWLAGNPDAGPNTKTVQVSASLDIGNYSFDYVAAGGSLADMKWTQKTFDFTAPLSGTVTLTFLSTVLSGGTAENPAAFGPALDNVSLTESAAAGSTLLPAAWTMMVGGLTGFGYIARRRAKKGG